MFWICFLRLLASPCSNHPESKWMGQLLIGCFNDWVFSLSFSIVDCIITKGFYFVPVSVAEWLELDLYYSNKVTSMQSGVFHSTLNKASLAEEKQFSNFVTTVDSISTIGFPTKTSKDSNNLWKRDTDNQKPEKMATAQNYDSNAFATALDNEDAMSQ